MTTFERSGYYRYSSKGNRHWVEAHDVTRTDWSRSSWVRTSSHPPEPESAVPATVAYDGHKATFVNPNALCPVCGASVFYYQNEFGSRVFFDEIGPPWPKHPCTDGQRLSEDAPTESRPSTPVILIERQALLARPTSPTGWECLLVTGRVVREQRLQVTARPFFSDYARRVRFSLPEGTAFPQIGEVFFLKNDRAAYFDFKQFEPRQVTIEPPLPKNQAGSKRAKKRRLKKMKRR